MEGLGSVSQENTAHIAALLLDVVPLLPTVHHSGAQPPHQQHPQQQAEGTAVSPAAQAAGWSFFRQRSGFAVAQPLLATLQQASAARRGSFTFVGHQEEVAAQLQQLQQLRDAAHAGLDDAEGASGSQGSSGPFAEARACGGSHGTVSSLAAPAHVVPLLPHVTPPAGRHASATLAGHGQHQHHGQHQKAARPPSTAPSTITMASRASVMRRTLMRPLAHHHHNTHESLASMLSSVVSGATSVLVPPAPQASMYDHSLEAQPSFELRKLPAGSVAFAVLNAVMLLALLAAAVVELVVKSQAVTAGTVV
jgi:hypothetical protein